MYICVCKGVRERDIRELATTAPQVRMRDLRVRLGVCSECGKCGKRALGLLRDQCETVVNLDLQPQE